MGSLSSFLHTLTMQKYTVSFLLVFLIYFLSETARAESASEKCPKDCNGHGKCVSINGTATCVCQEQWGGYTCADSNYNLTSDHPLSVTIHKNEYYYFTLEINEKPVEKVIIKYFVWGYSKKSDVKGPAIYVGYNVYPNITHYNVTDNSTVLKKNLTISHSRPGIWYLAVVGQDSDPLILTVQANVDNSTNTPTTTVMDDPCSSTITNGRQFRHSINSHSYSKCVCTNTESVAASCDTYAKPLLNDGKMYDGVLTTGVWSYWYFNITDQIVKPHPLTSIAVSVTVGNDQSSPEIHFLNDNIHTKSETSSIMSTTVTRTVAVRPTQIKDILYIGIHGNSAIPYTAVLRTY